MVNKMESFANKNLHWGPPILLWMSCTIHSLVAALLTFSINNTKIKYKCPHPPPPPRYHYPRSNITTPSSPQKVKKKTTKLYSVFLNFYSYHGKIIQNSVVVFTDNKNISFLTKIIGPKNLVAYPVHASKIQAHLESHGAKMNPLRDI